MFRYFHRKNTRLIYKSGDAKQKLRFIGNKWIGYVFFWFLKQSLFSSISKHAKSNSGFFMLSMKHYSSIYHYMLINFLFRSLMCMLGENGKLKCSIDLMYVYVHCIHFLHNFCNKIRICLDLIIF